MIYVAGVGGSVLLSFILWFFCIVFAVHAIYLLSKELFPVLKHVIQTILFLFTNTYRLFKANQKVRKHYYKSNPSLYKMLIDINKSHSMSNVRCYMSDGSKYAFPYLEEWTDTTSAALLPD